MKLSKIIILIFSVIFICISISNLFSNINFLRSEKREMMATIQEVDGRKVYFIPDLGYTVKNQEPTMKEVGNIGEKVTVYSQKDRPYIVYRSKKPKGLWLNVLKPLGVSILLLIYIYLFEKFLPKLIKMKVEDHAHT